MDVVGERGGLEEEGSVGEDGGVDVVLVVEEVGGHILPTLIPPHFHLHLPPMHLAHHIHRNLPQPRHPTK